MEAKHRQEVEEHHAEYEGKDKERDSRLSALMDQREQDIAMHSKEHGVLQGRDHRIPACLSRLDDALLGMLYPFVFLALSPLFL
jgi:hypothetical protein